LLAFRDDPDLRVRLSTGEGPKFFLAGWELKAAADAGRGVDGDTVLAALVACGIARHEKPVIPLPWNGICCGGGSELSPVS